MVHTVGVTGMGIISSIGNNVADFSTALEQGKCGIRFRDSGREPEVAVRIAAEIADFSFLEELQHARVMPEQMSRKAKRLGQRAPFTIQTSILSAMEAWQDAALTDHSLAGDRIGLIIAGQNTTQNYQYGLNAKFREHPEYLSPRYALEFLETNQLGVLSELFSIHGEGFVVGGASATGNVGLIKGYHAVKSGLVDICLVVGVMADLSPMDIQGFINIGAMGGKHYGDQPQKACRPFDKRHEGFIYGQAGACLVLESEQSASHRGKSFWAELKGGAILLDANSSADPNLEGEKKVMLSALAEGNLATEDVDYINTHGSSSPLGDVTEAEAISGLFGERAKEIWINATKGLTGHCLYSAGLVEVIATILQMKKGFIHGNRNLEEPVRNDIRFCGPEVIKGRINIALSNSFGFGGINTSVAIKNMTGQ